VLYQPRRQAGEELREEVLLLISRGRVGAHPTPTFLSYTHITCALTPALLPRPGTTSWHSLSYVTRHPRPGGGFAKTAEEVPVVRDIGGVSDALHTRSIAIVVFILAMALFFEAGCVEFRSVMAHGPDGGINPSRCGW
jgi:hypothetical protein